MRKMPKENLAQEWFSRFYRRFARIRAKNPSFGVNVSKSEWTRDMIDFLEDFGKEQGFNVRRERLTIDQVWESATKGIVAIEHENAPETVLKKELPNLMGVASDLKVLITYVRDYKFPWEPQILSERIMKRIDAKHSDQCKEFLLIVGTKSPTKKGQVKRTFMEREIDWFARRFFVGGIKSEILIPSSSLRARKAWKSRKKEKEEP
jgi:hypothetical protein